MVQKMWCNVFLLPPHKCVDLKCIHRTIQLVCSSSWLPNELCIGADNSNQTVNYLLVLLLTFASVFIYIITRSLRGFARHVGKMRGKNFIWLSLFIVSKEVLFNVCSQMCIWMWGQRETGTLNFLCWFPPHPVQNRTGKALECTDSFIDCPFCSDMPAPLKWCLAGVSECTWLLWDNDKLVESWWLQKLRVPHQCPRAICVLCQGGATEYHVSRRVMSSSS